LSIYSYIVLFSTFHSLLDCIFYSTITSNLQTFSHFLRILSMSFQLFKRDTLFNMKDLREVEQSTLTTESRDNVTESKRHFQNHSISKNKDSKRKRFLSLQRIEIDTRLEIREYKRMKNESLWKSYKKIFQLKLDHFITVAVQKESLCKHVVMKSFLKSDSYKKLHMLHHIQHDNFVVVLESFSFKKFFYVILEHMNISLVQIIASSLYFDEQKLTVILEQIDLTDEMSRRMC